MQHSQFKINAPGLALRRGNDAVVCRAPSRLLLQTITAMRRWFFIFSIFPLAGFSKQSVCMGVVVSELNLLVEVCSAR
jgi:hypothetical protein